MKTGGNKKMAADYVRALKWPIIGWIVVDIALLVSTYVGGFMEMLTPGSLAPVLLAFGAWAGYKIVEFKGKFVDVIIAGVVIGLVCGGLALVLFAVRNVPTSVWPASFTFDVLMNIVGAIIAGGFALTK